MEVILLVGLAVGVDYSLFYMRREREERAAGRSEGAALRGRRRHLRARGARLGHHRPDRDGRDVPVGRQDVHVLLGRHDDRRRRRHDRLADRPAGRALQARRPRREGPHPVPRPPAHARRGPHLGRHRRRASCAARSSRPSPRPRCCRARRSRRSACTPRRPAWRASRSSAIEPFKKFIKAFPGTPDPAVVAIKGDDDTRAGTGRDRRAEGQGARDAGRSDPRADRRRDQPRRRRRPGRGPARGQRHRRRRPTPRSRRCATELLPATVGEVDGARGRGHRRHGQLAGLQRPLRRSSIPLVFGFVLLFAFVLLLVTFRSIVIALKAIVLNLLSVGAAYGVLVAVFQWGWGESLLGFTVQRRHRQLAADVHVRDPVRPLDGLPRVHPEPDPRGARPRHVDRPARSRTASRRRPAR